MKNKKYIFIPVVLIIITIPFIVFKNQDNNNKKVEEKEPIQANNNLLSYMLETEAGTAIYEETSRSTWPSSSEYIFNSTKSVCENGSTLIWNGSQVIMKGTKADKCYIYFDKYASPVVNSISETIKSNSITITVNATSAMSTITKYYYYLNDTLITNSTSNTYTYTGLTQNTTYTIKVIAEDANNVQGSAYTKSITTSDSITLANYIISESQTDSHILHHDSSLTNGAKDNSYRYTGRSGVNNYVCFGSDSYSNGGTVCPNENLYRIIGVFDYNNNGTYQVKLIQADYATQTQLGLTAVSTTGSPDSTYASYYEGTQSGALHTFYWSRSSSITNNTWSNSDLYEALNNTITGFLRSANFSNNSNWTNKIATTTWYVGGAAYANVYNSPVTTAYQYEVGANRSSTTVNAKVGLMYVSDYGYAASQSNWTKNMGSLNNNTNRQNNWLYQGVHDWTISRRSDSSANAFRVDNTGFVRYCDVSGNMNEIRPSFILDPGEEYGGGEGTAAAPYRIIL